MEESSVSTFNEASFKMKRLHELQDRCNKMRERPFFYMDEFKQPGFKIHYDCLVSLFQEIASKCTDKEKNGNKDKEDGIKPKLKALKIIVRSLKSNANKEDKDKVEDELQECEEIIRQLLDQHGFSTMNMEDTQGDQYT